MTDPLSNREIEDVLASIRRLVAQEPEVPAQHGPAARVRTPAAGRLVLTPAFRVGDGSAADTSGELSPEEPSDPVTGGSAQQLPDQEPPKAASMTLERTIAELEEAVLASGDDWEPDGSEIATVEEAPFVEVDPDSEPPQDNVRMFHLPPNRKQAAAEAEESAVQADDDAPAQHDEPAVQDAAENVTSEDIIAPEPEAEEPDDQTALFAAASAATDDAPILDEEALREMVTQILREELQGHLGERITRNVRKMVRAEIARALAAKGLS